MRRVFALCPKAGTLGDTETMLLVDDGNAESMEYHGVFEYGMGSYQYLDVASDEVVEYGLALLAFHDACKQFHSNVHSLEEVTDGLEMLFGKNFRWCHQACLIPIVEGDEHGHEGNECLAGTHVAL